MVSRMCGSSRYLSVLSAMLWLTACSSAPLSPQGTLADEGRRAGRIVQDREHELAAARAQIAATQIAAAKKEAELQELQAILSQLRQESAEARQAVLEWQRIAEARQVELTALQSEREQSHSADIDQLMVLKDKVETLSRELSEVKQTMIVAGAQTAGPTPTGQTRSEGTVKRRATKWRDSILSFQEGTTNRIIPVAHVVRDESAIPIKKRVTIQPGDTLWGLARRHQTTVAALRAANGLQGEQLIVGKELTLP
jgi:LysM repeat protein